MNEDTVLQLLAESITRRGLAVPAIFLLELARPFAFLIGQALRVGSPLLDPLTGRAPSRYARMLEDPRHVEALLGLLEGGHVDTVERGG